MFTLNMDTGTNVPRGMCWISDGVSSAASALLAMTRLKNGLIELNSHLSAVIERIDIVFPDSGWLMSDVNIWE